MKYGCSGTSGTSPIGKSQMMAFANKRAKHAASEDELYEYAIRALGRKMRTVAELKRLLRNRVDAESSEGAQWIESVVSRLKEQRYLNDSEYAATYTRLRKENDRLGKRRVQQDLMVKGVHADVIAKTLDAGYSDARGNPEDEMKLARKFLERKRIRKPNDQKEAARIMRTLARAGYSTSTIYKVLKQWDVEVDEEAMNE